MRRPRLLCAAVAACAAVLTPGIAQAAPGDPAPGSPAYLARDAQNIADAYGRQTAPDGQLTPAYGLANAQVIGPVHVEQLLVQAATPTRPALSPGMAVPGWKLHPLKGSLAGHWAVWVDSHWRLTFAFQNGDGHDTVTDFNGAQGDRIAITDGSAYSTSTAAGSTVISYGTGTDQITLTGVSTFHDDWVVTA